MIAGPPSTGAGRASAQGKKSASPVAVAGIALSHPDKPYFPEAGLTKRDIAEYYEAVSPRLLPYLDKRPLSLVRCPDGWRGQCFYQKNADRAVDAAVDRIEVPEQDGTATYMGASSVEALVGLVQWGVVEIHPWGSRRPRLEFADQLIFDFDPDPSQDWKQVATAATLLRTLLEELSLRSFLKTTGGKGLHAVVPVRPTLAWDDAKGFCRAVAEHLVTTFPDRYVATASKARRAGRIFIDYLRNSQGATAIAPYGVRARENAPIAMPIEWDELRRDVRFDHFNVRNARKRVTRGTDPWADFATTRQSITKAAAARVGFELPGTGTVGRS